MIDDEGQVGAETLNAIGSNDIYSKPHRSIGALLAVQQSGGHINNRLRGTAFLIAPNLLLTPAHNCFDPKLGL